jgi:HK97 family phage major capsid protein
MSTRTRADEAHDVAEAAVAHLSEIDERLTALPASTPAATRRKLEAEFDAQHAVVTRKVKEADRLYSIEENGRRTRAAETGGGYAVARNSLRSEGVYRPDGSASFFADLVSHRSNPDAFGRLQAHQREQRDVTTGAPGGSEFVVPQYLQAAWIGTARAGRPFVDVLPRMNLPTSGMSFVLPRVATAPAVGVQVNEADAVLETDLDADAVTVYVRTFAGQNDISQQLLDRSDPSFDQVLFSELAADYDEKLDVQCLAGTGSNGQHLGVRAVTNINTQTYTATTPVATGLISKVYGAISDIATNRKRSPNAIVMHPRRAAWLAASLSSSFPLVQQGQLMQAVGVQDGGFLRTFAGLQVVADPNIGTTYGAGTNEDEIYVVFADDLLFAEGPMQARVLHEVLSGTLQVRVQVFAYSAFASARYPKAIAKVSGTGLAAPTF